MWLMDGEVSVYRDVDNCFLVLLIKKQIKKKMIRRLSTFICHITITIVATGLLPVHVILWIFDGKGLPFSEWYRITDFENK